MQTERIRDVIRYIKKFRGSTIVIRVDDDVADSSLFAGHMHDLALLQETGIRFVIVPGAAKSHLEGPRRVRRGNGAWKAASA
jgi:amino-acid N-acetyltransferase